MASDTSTYRHKSRAGRQERRRLRRLLSAFPLGAPDEETWRRLDRWVDVAGDAGERFGLGDLLIAAVGARHGAAVWSLDSDFERMARLGFIRLHPSAA